MNMIFKMIVVVTLFASGFIVGAILGLTEKPKSSNEIVSVSFSDSSKLVEFAQPVVEDFGAKSIETVKTPETTETTEPTKSVEVVEETQATEASTATVVGLFPEALLPTKEDLKEEVSSFKFFEEEPKEMICELAKPVDIRVGGTKFGGRWDMVVEDTEKGAVGGNRLRSLDDKNDLYIAWPMPGVNANNPNSPLQIPCVESFFANGATSISKKIENANKGLRDYYAKIVHVDEDGIERVVYARIEDRGPRKSTRFDASRAVWEGLGLSHILKGSPDSESNKVNLTISLIHKDDIDPEKIEETEFTSSNNSDDKTKWYGPQGEVTEEEIAEIQFSKAGGGKFQLPSRDRSEEETTTIASNP